MTGTSHTRRTGEAGALAGNRSRRAAYGRAFEWLCLAATCLGIAMLVVLLVDVLRRGLPTLTPHFLTSFPSRFPERAGIKAALVGSLWLISLVALFAIPTGVAAAVWLEEYPRRGRLSQAIEVNIANLAGVPSIIYGLLGLGIFVRTMGFGRSLISGALTMALLILPVIIIASQEAIRAVPLSLRQAAYALGATQWQVARHHVLPAAMPGILTGTILALSRAIGETAPLLVVGAAAFLTYNPTGLTSGFTALPIQIYEWTSRPGEDFKDLASAGIILLLAVLLTMNAAAILLRQRFSRRARW